MNGPYKLKDIVGERYEIFNFVGEGGMQYVYKAKDLILNRYVALKTPKSLSAQKRFSETAIVAAKVNHPNVAKTLDYFEDGKVPHLVEELVEGGDLDTALLRQCKTIDPYLVARVLHHLARGVAASHHVGVIHRDLKPSNIMVSGGVQLDAIKITDFGIAKMAEEEIASAAETETISSSHTAFGALPYMAPEAILTPRKVTPKADIWSLGAMVFELLTGIKPFGSGLIAAHSIVEGKIADIPPHLKANAQFNVLFDQILALVHRCLTNDPLQRPSADEISTSCSSLCYPVSARYTGRVNNILFNSYGFIDCDDGEKAFFHLYSVFGITPGKGSRVMLSRYSGGKADRAHPVVRISQD